MADIVFALVGGKVTKSSHNFAICPKTDFLRTEHGLLLKTSKMKAISVRNEDAKAKSVLGNPGSLV